MASAATSLTSMPKLSDARVEEILTVMAKYRAKHRRWIRRVHDKARADWFSWSEDELRTFWEFSNGLDVLAGDAITTTIAGHEFIFPVPVIKPYGNREWAVHANRAADRRRTKP